MPPSGGLLNASRYAGGLLLFYNPAGGVAVIVGNQGVFVNREQRAFYALHVMNTLNTYTQASSGNRECNSYPG